MDHAKKAEVAATIGQLRKDLQEQSYLLGEDAKKIADDTKDLGKDVVDEI